jgi:hypothetical protein
MRSDGERRGGMTTQQSAAVPGTQAERPLRTYAAIMTVFLGGFGGVFAAASVRRSLPERLSTYDLLLAGIAGHKLSRLIVKDEVTAPLRAPFVVVSEDEEGTLSEEPRGDGFRRAVGELVTCPSCVGQWACAAFVAGLMTAPRTTRATASVFVADAISDFLHVAYRVGKERA